MLNSQKRQLRTVLEALCDKCDRLGSEKGQGKFIDQAETEIEELMLFYEKILDTPKIQKCLEVLSMLNLVTFSQTMQPRDVAHIISNFYIKRRKL